MVGFPGAAAVVAVAWWVLVAVASCAAAGLCPALAACGVPLWCPCVVRLCLPVAVWHCAESPLLRLLRHLPVTPCRGGVPQR